MENSAINKALHRVVKKTSKYDKYLKKTSCKSTFLGEYTTTGGMTQMRYWAIKHSSYTKELATVLKQKTVEATVQSIYNFTYNHIQYQADGYDQNLKSPSCVWSTRFEGVDCKSYSVFISTILLNLGIKHFFRKVKQPGSPERWSHVYVVINYNNKEYIIDPTKHINTEVTYLEKEDMEVKLPYYGLHGAVSDKHLIAIENFKKYLLSLEKKGVSKSITSKILNAVRISYESGKEPQMRISRNVITVNSNDYFLQQNVGLNGFLDDLLNKAKEEGETAYNNVLNSYSSSNTSTSSGGSFVGEVIGVFTDLFGPEDWASVELRFKGYFESIKKEVERRLQTATTATQLTDIDRYLSVAIVIYSDTSYWDSDNSKKGHALVGTMLSELQKALRDYISKSYNYTTKSDTTYPGVYKDPRGFEYGNKGSITYRNYTSLKPKSSTPTTETPTTETPNTNVDSNQNTSTPNKNVNTAGIGGGKIALVALILGGGFLLLNKGTENKEELIKNRNQEYEV
ncbi:hypothetical protein ACIVBQ_000560 [Tenacibaculum discolor]